MKRQPQKIWLKPLAQFFSGTAGRKQGKPWRFRRGWHHLILLDKDYDYLYDVGDYVVHLQVKDGAIAFDSQCPTMSVKGW